MRNSLRWPAFVALIGGLVLADTGAAAQDPGAAVSIDPAVSGLAAQIATRLQKQHIHKIAIVDLRGPEKEAHPFGVWLADGLAASFKRDFPDLQVIARGANPTRESMPIKKDDPAWTETKEWARKLGADVVVTGDFARLSRGVGVSLTATKVNNQGPMGTASGLVPMSDEISSLSGEPIPAFTGAARAGVAGTGIPACVSCPVPEYTDKARAAKYEGTVVLQVVVTRDGRASDISVISGQGLGLEDNAIKAVRRWRFKPALSAEGDPVDVSVPIEVTFRLYRGH